MYNYALYIIDKTEQKKASTLPIIFDLENDFDDKISFKDWLKKKLISIGLVGKRNINEKFEELFAHRNCLLMLDGF